MTNFSFKEYKASISDKLRVKFASKTIKKAPKKANIKLKKPNLSTETACSKIIGLVKRHWKADRSNKNEINPQTIAPVGSTGTTKDWSLIL